MAKLMSNLPGGASQAGLAVGDLALRKFQIEQSARQAREQLALQRERIAQQERQAKEKERMERARLQAIAQILKGSQDRGAGKAPSGGAAAAGGVPRVDAGALPPIAPYSQAQVESPTSIGLGAAPPIPTTATPGGSWKPYPPEGVENPSTAVFEGKTYYFHPGETEFAPRAIGEYEGRQGAISPRTGQAIIAPPLLQDTPEARGLRRGAALPPGADRLSPDQIAEFNELTRRRVADAARMAAGEPGAPLAPPGGVAPPAPEVAAPAPAPSPLVSGPGQQLPIPTTPPGVRDIMAPAGGQEFLDDPSKLIHFPPGFPTREEALGKLAEKEGALPGATQRAGGLVWEGAPVATDYAKPTRRAPRRPAPSVEAREDRMIARLQKGAEAASALGKSSVAAQIQHRISRIERRRQRRQADAKVLAREQRDEARDLAREQKKEAAKEEAANAEDAGRDAYLTAETPEALKEARKGLPPSVSNKLGSTFRMRLNRLREIEEGKRIYETPAKLEAAALDAARKEMYGKGGALYLGMEKVIRRELNKRGANLKSGWFVTDDPVTKEHEKQYERIRTDFHRQRFLGDQQRLDARVGKGRPSAAKTPFAQWVDGTEGGVPTPGAAPAPTPPAAAPKQAAAPSGMSAAGKRVWRAMQAGEDSPQLEAMFEKLPKAEKDAIVRMARQRR